MNKPTRQITHADIILVQNWAKDFLIQLPYGIKLPNMVKPLNDGERLALAFIDAVLNMIGPEAAHIKTEVVASGNGPL